MDSASGWRLRNQRGDHLSDVQRLSRAYGSQRFLCEGQTVTVQITGTFLSLGYLYDLAVVPASKVERWRASFDHPELRVSLDEDVFTAPFDQDRQRAEIRIPYTDGFNLDRVYEIFVWGPEHPQGLPLYLQKITISPRRNFSRFKIATIRWGQRWVPIATLIVALATLIITIIIMLRE